VKARALLALARKELRAVRRNPWFWLLTVGFLGLAAFLAWAGVSGGGTGLPGFGRTGASLVSLALLFLPLNGLVTGSISLTSERERGTLLYLLAHPLGGTEVLLGKFLGAGLALIASAFIGFGGAGLVLLALGGVPRPLPLVHLALLSALLSLAGLALGLAVGAAAPRSAAGAGGALFLWLALTLLGDLGLLGTSLVLELTPGQLLFLALLNPLHAYRLAALAAAGASLESLGPAAVLAERTFGKALEPLLVGLLVGWTLVGLFASGAALRRGRGL
jgi:Cu-processing system permease protein